MFFLYLAQNIINLIWPTCLLIGWFLYYYPIPHRRGNIAPTNNRSDFLPVNIVSFILYLLMFVLNAYSLYYDSDISYYEKITVFLAFNLYPILSLKLFLSIAYYYIDNITIVRDYIFHDLMKYPLID